MSNQAILGFLRGLATDAAFRAAVEADPVAEFAKVGIKVNPAEVPPEGIKLPSAASILGNLDHLAERVESTSGEIFFCI